MLHYWGTIVSPNKILLTRAAAAAPLLVLVVREGPLPSSRVKNTQRFGFGILGFRGLGLGTGEVEEGPISRESKEIMGCPPSR